jgi:hypothetical protein
MRYIDPDGREVSEEEVGVAFDKWVKSRDNKLSSADYEVKKWMENTALGARGRIPTNDEINQFAEGITKGQVPYEIFGTILLGSVSSLWRTRVFWSGGRNLAGQAAMDWAKTNGGVTLEMTIGGRLMESFGKYLPRSIQGKLWEVLSRCFALSAQISGSAVHVFHNTAGISVKSYWKMEYEILKTTVRIIYHLFTP